METNKFENMKSTIKNVIVKIKSKQYQVEVDAAIFDDIFIEAATRVVEHHKKDIKFFTKLMIISECYENKDAKKPEKHYQINMYHILVNAGLYSLGELLREKTKNLHNIDLQLEPVRANAGKSSRD